jgi:transcription initiation factor TFIIIB Brf1 subunit/transcription initiation factor TFIIB
MNTCPKCGSPQVEEHTNYAKETGRTWWGCGTFQTRDCHPHYSDWCLEREERKALQCKVDELQSKLDNANAELERERMRLAACGVVADANTPESAKKWRNMRDEYRSASCDGVARAVDREMRLRRALQKIGNDPCVPPMIADEALTAIDDVRAEEEEAK